VLFRSKTTSRVSAIPATASGLTTTISESVTR